MLKEIGWAPDAAAPFVQHVRVDHRRLHIDVPEQLLHGSDVVAGHEQVGRERMPEHVARDALGEPGSPTGDDDGPLKQRFVDVMTTLFTGLRVLPPLLLREHELPEPVSIRLRKLPSQGVGEFDSTVAVGKIPLVNRMNPPEVFLQRLNDDLRQRRNSVFVTFALANR